MDEMRLPAILVMQERSIKTPHETDLSLGNSSVLIFIGAMISEHLLIFFFDGLLPLL